MKILMINHFPLEGSGSGTYTKNLATQLVKLGHEVCVVLPENTPNIPQYEGVRLHPVMFTDKEPIPGALPFNFPCFTTHPRSVVAFSDLSEDQMAAYTGAFQKAIDEEVRTFQPNIVHGQHVWILPSLAVGCGVPLVLTVHGTDLMGFAKWPEMRHYAQRAMDAASKAICISADNEKLTAEAFPEHMGKVVRMRNGYNPDIFYPQALDRATELERYGVPYNGEKLVLFAGKLTHFKGVDVLLDAAAYYEADPMETVTVIAGDGEKRDELKEQAARLGLRTVNFIGNVSQDALARLYNIADVDLVPSRNEPFGLVAVEAMACGTPVVAANCGGLPGFVNSSVGALSVPEDAADLSRCILDTLQRTEADETWRSRIADYASNNYSQAVIIRELESLYEEVIRENA